MILYSDVPRRLRSGPGCARKLLSDRWIGGRCRADWDRTVARVDPGAGRTAAREPKVAERRFSSAASNRRRSWNQPRDRYIIRGAIRPCGAVMAWIRLSALIEVGIGSNGMQIAFFKGSHSARPYR
jgi:hypothetical protein